MAHDVVSNFKIVETEKLENGCKYKIGLQLEMKAGWYEDVYFCIHKGNDLITIKLKHKENKDELVYFETEEDIFLETRAIYKYYFSYKVNGFRRFIKKEDVIGFDGIVFEEMYRMSVNFKAPEWAKGRMMYHIFVDRFHRGSIEPMKEMVRRHIHKSWDEPVVVEGDEHGIWNNDFYGGDLKGIINKLDYIESLGIDILYLSPIVYSQSTHRYDTSDYEMVDPYAGTIEDLKELCEEVHKRGMKIILDAVFNHTGSDSKYFNKFQNKEWIEKENDRGAYWDNNSKFSSFYSNYVDSRGNKQFCYWWGFDTLPVCYGGSLEWQNYITGVGGVIDQWFACGIDGLRLDVADELTDYYIELIRKAVHRNKSDGFILGEVWENPMYMGRGYIEEGKGMDTIMDYNFIKALIRYFRYGEADELAAKIRECKNTYPVDTFFTAMHFTSTHDMSRGISLWDCEIFNFHGKWPWNLHNEDHKFAQEYNLTPQQYEEAKNIFQAYVFFLTFYPGMLSIFAGDELGTQGIGNLDNRKPMPWNSYDEKLLEYFRSVGKIRKKERFMYDADIIPRDININYASFERIKDEERVLVIVNRTGNTQEFIVPSDYQEPESVYTLKLIKPGVIGPYGAVALKARKS